MELCNRDVIVIFQAVVRSVVHSRVFCDCGLYDSMGCLVFSIVAMGNFWRVLTRDALVCMMGSNVALLNSGVFVNNGRIVVNDLFLVLMEMLNVVAGLRIMILVVKVFTMVGWSSVSSSSSNNSIILLGFIACFVFIFFGGGRCVILLCLVGLLPAGIVTAIIARMVRAHVTGIVFSILTGIIAVATVGDSIFTGLIFSFLVLIGIVARV